MKSVIYERDSYWREVCMHCALIVMLVLSTLLSPLVVLAKANGGGLFDGQILHIACNGDATDQSGQNHPVENVGVTFVSDKILKLGRSCFFAGNDYLRIANNPDFSLSNFTIAAWVLVESEVVTYNGEARAIVSNYDESAPFYGIGIYSGAYLGKAVTFFDGGTGLNGAIDTAGSSLADTKWHHITAVFKGGVNVELYVDGMTKSRSVGAMPATISPTGDLFIGRDGNAEKLLLNKWVGSMDDIRIFNRALVAEEVGRLASVVDLPTGETFTPLGIGENDPYLLETEEGPLTAMMVTPNADGSVSLNRVPSGERKLREGEAELPPITSTLVLDLVPEEGRNMSITYLDENLPGVVATMNVAGDLEVTDESIPDLKAILYRLEDRFTFLLRSDPSIKVKVNHDGTLEIIDENRPHLSIHRDNDGNYMIVDNNTKAVILADRNGDAVLSHPDMPDNIVATFNIFDSEGKYSLVDRDTNECVENISSSGTRGLGDFLKGIGKSVVDNVKSTVTSVVGTFASDTTRKLLTGVATGAKALASTAVKAAGGISQWLACAPALTKFAVVGGAIAAVALVGYGIYTLFKQRKEIKKLRKQVQRLEATVQIQAAQIAELQKTVADQAQRIQILEAEVAKQADQINQQAEEIAALKDENAKIREELAKQKEVTAAMQDRIADLEERLRKAEEGLDQFEPGDPIIPTPLRKSSGLRKDEVQACIKVPGVNLQFTVAERFCQSKVVKVKWNTRVELGNAGFNVYRAQQDADGEFINITKLNAELIPTEGNGVGRNDYLFVDSTQSFSEEYLYGIESVDTVGDTFMFDEKIVKAEECLLATLKDFKVKPANDSVFLTWKTDMELNTKGFHLWRAKAPASGRCINDPAKAGAYQDVVRLSDELMPAEGSPYDEASYAFIDESVKSKVTYCYGLEEAANDGSSKFYWDNIITATVR